MIIHDTTSPAGRARFTVDADTGHHASDDLAGRPGIQDSRVLPATRRAPRGLRMNHSEVVLAAPPSGRGLAFNHSEVVLAARPTRCGINLNHNESVWTAEQARRSR